MYRNLARPECYANHHTENEAAQCRETPGRLLPVIPRSEATRDLIFGPPQADPPSSLTLLEGGASLRSG
jgi:hypothetical protein